MSMLPSDVGQQALDAAGIDYTIGDIQEGSKQANVLLRAYPRCLRQMLRAAHWNFARATSPLQLLADATGQTPNVPTNVPIGMFVYEYAYPPDCAKARFVPWQPQNQNPGVPAGNIQIPSTPTMTNLGQQPIAGARTIPARFVEATDPNFPPVAQPSSSFVLGPAVTITAATRANPCTLTAPSNNLANGNLIYISGVLGMTQLNGNTYQVVNVNAGAGTFTLEDALGNAINSTAFGTYISGGTLQKVQPALQNPAPTGQGINFWEIQGISPQGRTVILTNVKNASLVYTRIMLYPSNWDELFRAALVSFMASEIALPLSTDKKFGLQLRNEQIKIAKEKITQARLTDGNEAWSRNDISVDWMQFRNTGGGIGGPWGPGPWGVNDGAGFLGYGWDTASFADGSCY